MLGRLADQPYGRGSVIVDPFGHRWMLLRPPARATRLRQGDVANVTMVAPDAHRAKKFYEAVLQVPFSPAHPGAWRTGETRPPLGIVSPEGAEPGVQLSYRIDDIAAAVERVRAAGGRADEPARRPFGLSAECVDDQGATFRLWQPADRSARTRRRTGHAAWWPSGWKRWTMPPATARPTGCENAPVLGNYEGPHQSRELWKTGAG